MYEFLQDLRRADLGLRVGDEVRDILLESQRAHYRAHAHLESHHWLCLSAVL